MIPEELKINEHELRKSIARRQYDSLPGHMDDLRRMADQHISGLSTADPLRHQIAAWMLATIEWARLMVVAQRQGCSDELDRLPKVGYYLDRRTSREPRFCMDL